MCVQDRVKKPEKSIELSDQKKKEKKKSIEPNRRSYLCCEIAQNVINHGLHIVNQNMDLLRALTSMFVQDETPPMRC